MNQWGEFVFHEPYAGDKIERINNVVLPKQYLPSLDKGTHGQKRVNLCPCFVTFTPRTSSTRRSSALQGQKFISFRLCDPKS